MTSSAQIPTLLGGVIDQTRVTLGLHAPELNAEQVTALMGVQPTRSNGAWWSLEVNAEAPEDPEVAIARLLAMLSTDNDFWAGIHARYRAELNLMLVVKAWKRGFQLSASTANELARRGLSLTFEVYAEPQQMPSACFA